MRLGIIGATGSSGSALTRALLADGLAPASSPVLLNRSAGRPIEFGGPGIAWATNVADLVAQVNSVIIAVRPEDFAGLRLRAPHRLVISLMAEVTGSRVVRAMPNAVAEARRSYTPRLAGPGVTVDHKAFLCSVLATIGTRLGPKPTETCSRRFQVPVQPIRRSWHWRCSRRHVRLATPSL